MSNPNPPRANHAAAFLSHFKQRAPQTAVAIATLSSMAVMAPEARADEAARLEARIPSARATASLAATTPEPIAGDRCFGPVRPSYDPAIVLAFDRRLSVAVWLDARGEPTEAPPYYVRTPVRILGAAPEAMTPSEVTYLFAERQDPRVQAQTFERLREALAVIDLAAVEAVWPGPFARCGFAELRSYGYAVHMGQWRREGFEHRERGERGEREFMHERGREIVHGTGRELITSGERGGESRPHQGEPRTATPRVGSAAPVGEQPVIHGAPTTAPHATPHEQAATHHGGPQP